MKTGIRCWSDLSQFLERAVFQRNIINKIKTRVLCSITFFSKIMSLMKLYGKVLYSQAGHRWHYGVCALPVRFLSRQTHSEYVIIIFFSTATMIARTRLSVTFYVHCLSFLIFPLCANKMQKNFSVSDCLTWSSRAGHLGLWDGWWWWWLDSRPSCSTPGYGTASTMWVGGCVWPRYRVDASLKGWIPILEIFLGHQPYCLHYKHTHTHTRVCVCVCVCV